MAKLRTTLGWIGAAGASVAAAAVSCPAFAAASSAWIDSAHSAVRLIPAGVAQAAGDVPAGSRLAGIEVRLDPGFITYWRSPGDAGVPPSFGFGGSANLKDARVAYPAPSRLDEGGADAFGYTADVVFPLVVVPGDPARPVTLDVTLDYAVCANICLPAKAHVATVLDGSGSAEEPLVRRALERVPRASRVGAAGPLRIDAVKPGPAGGFVAEATTPEGTGTLFGEAPEPWFLTTSAGQPAGDGHVRFTIAVSGGAPASVPDAPVRLTLVSPAGAVEVAVRLDALAPKP